MKRIYDEITKKELKVFFVSKLKAKQEKKKKIKSFDCID